MTSVLFDNMFAILVLKKTYHALFQVHNFILGFH